MVKREYTADEIRKYKRQDVTSKAYNLRGRAEKKGGKALRANVENAYRREWGDYIEPNRKSFSSGENPNKDQMTAVEIRNLDPTGARYEDAGDLVAAANSRIAQAKALTSRGNQNYHSAGVLYAAAGEYDKAIGAYKEYLKINPGNSIPQFLKYEAKEKISLLEKKLEAQKNRLERRRLAHASLSIVSIIASIFLLSPNITGNAIGNQSFQTSGIIGTLLLFMGIIAGYFFFKKR
jgi:tetratricopeptide (TPR) repeat protein